MATLCEWTRPGDEPCCCEVGCCLYPWPDPNGTEGGPFYPTDDLPDTVVVELEGGTTITLDRITGEYAFGETGLYPLGISVQAAYVDPITEEPVLAWVIALDNQEIVGGWMKPCLSYPPGEFGVSDEFPDTLLLDVVLNSGSSPETNVPLSRDFFDRCLWSNPEFGPSPGYSAILSYDASVYKWRLIISNNIPYNELKNGDQNTPTATLGEFADFDSISNVVIHE